MQEHEAQSSSTAEITTSSAGQPKALIELIRNDGFAMSFQSVRQYREALLRGVESAAQAELGTKLYTAPQPAPAVPKGFEIARSTHDGDTDIRLSLKAGEAGYLMSAWLSESGRDEYDTEGRLAYRLAEALLSAQPVKLTDFRPALSTLVRACQRYVDSDGEEDFPEDELLAATVELEQDAHCAALRSRQHSAEQQPAPDVAGLVKALEDIAGTHHHSASAGEYFANVARKAIAAHLSRGGEV